MASSPKATPSFYTLLIGSTFFAISGGFGRRSNPTITTNKHRRTWGGPVVYSFIHKHVCPFWSPWVFVCVFWWEVLVKGYNKTGFEIVDILFTAKTGSGVWEDVQVSPIHSIGITLNSFSWGLRSIIISC